MQYEQALRHWGAARLNTAYVWRLRDKRVDPATVTVEFSFKPGNPCCAGQNPDCYCSMAESPTADVVIRGMAPGVKQVLYDEIEAADFDFAKTLAEIVAAGDGTLTLEDLSLPSSSYDA